MKATETQLQNFLTSSNTQFAIPIYQRNYDWGYAQCKQLLMDILAISKTETVHFIGSIVYIHEGINTIAEIKEFKIIDGQQRLTTFIIIYLVLHRLANEIGDTHFANKILKQYLINEFASDERNKFKLQASPENDIALQYLLRNDPNEKAPPYFSNIIKIFNFFKNEINKDNYLIIEQGLSKFIFVEVALESGKDNPQKIFESLNSTGLDLSQADLIRNYILMGLNSADQNDIYSNYWKIIEILAKNEINHESKLSDFIRDFITLKKKDIPNKTKVYESFKQKYPNLDCVSSVEKISALKENLLELKSLANFYNKLLNPANETEYPEICKELENIHALDMNVAYPFLMQVYKDFHNNKINKDTFVKILQLIQSFVWRRFIVGLSSNAHNKIFMTLYDKIDPENYLYSIEYALLKQSGTSKFPVNEDVIAALKIKDVYHITKKLYLLEKLESFGSKECVAITENITVEHIFPQTPHADWRKYLDENEIQTIKASYLHTLGNLSLSGSNKDLGNKYFIDKRDITGGYKDSQLWLNKNLASLEKWDIEEIEKRTQELTDRFLKIWKIPDLPSLKSIEGENEDEDEVNIFETTSPRHKKLEYAIFLNEKIEVETVSKLYAYVFKTLFEQYSEALYDTEFMKNTNTYEGSFRQPIAINDELFIESHMDSENKFSQIKKVLTLLGLESELLIKYRLTN